MASRISCGYQFALGLVAGMIGLLALAAVGEAAPNATPSPTPAKALTPTPAKTPAPRGGTAALVIGDAGAETLLGLPVQTSKGEDLGHVVDVVVDRSGALLAAIVDFGGFLGVGSRKIAVDWGILHFPKTDGMNKLIADLPLNQLREAPVFKPGEPIVIMGATAPPRPEPPKPTAPPKPRPTPSPAAGKP